MDKKSESKEKENIYSNGRQFAIRTVDIFVRQISNILIDEYLKEGYILDIADTETGIVFLQILHPMYIEGYGTSYKIGIYLGIEHADENYKNLNVISSIGMDKVGGEEGLDSYYKIYELNEKAKFENELKKILLDFYGFDSKHRFTFSFQET